MNTLVVIAHHNGAEWLAGLVESLSLEYPVFVVDTGSTEDQLARLDEVLLWRRRNANAGTWAKRIGGGYCVGAYEHAYRLQPKFDGYLFLHDSMRAKVSDVVERFERAAQARELDVVSWLGFPMDFDGGPQEAFLREHYGDLGDAPATAIFGPMFYAPREALEKLDAYGFPPHPKNRDELCALERGYAIAFHRAGCRIGYLEEYDNARIDARKDYLLFDKWRPNRE